MNPYFKAYLKNAAIGITSGSLVGATCGSGAGVAGLNQMCSGVMDTPSCNYLVSSAKHGAASSGAATGAVIGAALGAIVYPAYKAFVAWCYPNVARSIVIDAEMVQVTTESSPHNV